MKLFLLGYPGDMGGANTEAWHTIKLWRDNGVEVHLLPTWGHDDKWEKRLDEIGCTTHHYPEQELENVPGLTNSIVVGMCNSRVLNVWYRLKKMGCRLVWVNCMTFLFDSERINFSNYGPPDAMVYQSNFQRMQLEPFMAERCHAKPEQGHLIRGAFDIAAWPFDYTPRENDGDFVVGRIARPDADKWSERMWSIYEQISHPRRKALVLGVNDKTLVKIGQPPEWAECLKPMAVPVPEYLKRIHCIVTMNGHGTRENWPRIGLEAMAAGVPMIAPNDWGWREMIRHGVTGFLGSSDREMSRYATVLANDEQLRQQMAVAARERLVTELANPQILWSCWHRLFEQVQK